MFRATPTIEPRYLRQRRIDVTAAASPRCISADDAPDQPAADEPEGDRGKNLDQHVDEGRGDELQDHAHVVHRASSITPHAGAIVELSPQSRSAGTFSLEAGCANHGSKGSGCRGFIVEHSTSASSSMIGSNARRRAVAISAARWSSAMPRWRLMSAWIAGRPRSRSRIVRAASSWMRSSVLFSNRPSFSTARGDSYRSRVLTTGGTRAGHQDWRCDRATSVRGWLVPP